MTASPLLLEHFDTMLSTPADVEHLNRAILTLAVQGKLLEQDANDEAAFETLNKNGISKPLPVRKNEIPFSLPVGWLWVHIPDVTYSLGQKKPDKLFTYIDVSSIDNQNGVIGDELAIIDPENAPSRARKIVKEGCVIYSTVRPYLLNIAIVNHDIQPEPIVSTAFYVMQPVEGLDTKFLYLYLRSEFFTKFVESQMTGMAYPAISDGKMSLGLIPLPPLAEQKRIVARVETLFAQTRALSAKLAHAESEQKHLNQSALFHLLTAGSPEEFEKQWDFIAANFDNLFTQPEHIAPLRQSILELAVRGKLTRREAGDESVGELLKQIKTEKEKLGKAEALPPIKENEKPFALPVEWKWAKLGAIADVGTGSTPSRSNPDYYINGTIPWVTSGITNHPFISQTDELITEDAVRDTRLRIYPKHTLLVALYGQGKTRGQVSELLIDATINQACASLAFIGGSEHLRPYIKLFLLKNYREMRLLAEGGAQPNLNLNKIKQMPVSIPPLAEQAHIVARVDQLLGICDALESHLHAAQSERGRLVEFVLAGVGWKTLDVADDFVGELWEKNKK